jgi:homogentisate 1,2-dioxygenase
MVDSAFCSADGDLLFVPQQGEMLLQTECGNLEVSPGEIAVIPRGMRFRVEAVAGVLRGYICETFDGHLELPNLGPIGANGLANPRDFQVPTASFEDKEAPYTIYTKFCGELFRSHMAHSPFDVVAFHGNDVPYKYDLARFCPMNSVSYDHADPSIFTVLTCQTALPGVAALDFVVFPPRWSTAEHTFRPPYYHRNCMSEYMGLVFGNYEGKGEGLKPGGSTLHSCMTPHGPDAAAYEYGSNEALVPKRVGEGALAFMCESTYVLRLTPNAMDPQRLVASYRDCWKGLSSHFEPGEGAVAQGD